MESHNSALPQTIDITTVHAMFKQMESTFESRYEARLKALESSFRQQIANSTDDEQDEEGESRIRVDQDDDRMDLLIQDIERLKLKSRALKSSVQKMYDENNDMRSRIQKLELNNNKKMAVLTGLYTKGKKKEVIQDIELFLETEVGVTIALDDYFEIGSLQPKSKVLIFQSLRDKMLVMRHKNRLKNICNEDGKPYYINDYLPAEQVESDRHEQRIVDRNEQLDEEVKAKIEYKDGQMVIDQIPYAQPVIPPTPLKLLDVSTTALQDLLRLPICKGPQMELDDNKFVGFTLAVSNHEDINEAYLKMRLCYPKSRHIVCAYILGKDTKPHLGMGCCDDGEHGAGEKLLQYMIENNLEKRVIFVSREFSGRKIGIDRFKYILQAAHECMKLYPGNAIIDSLQQVNEELGDYTRFFSYKKKKEDTDTEAPQPTKRPGYADPKRAPPHQNKQHYSQKRRRDSYSPVRKIQRRRWHQDDSHHQQRYWKSGGYSREQRY